jgi:hypothetical protein
MDPAASSPASWEILQGTPAGASAVVELIHGGTRLELSASRWLFLHLNRLGAFDDLRALVRRGGEVRLLLEYDPHQRALYRTLLQHLGGGRADRVRFLMTSPPQLGLNDRGEVLYEIISGRSREGGQMVLMRTRGVPGSEERRREFDLLWDRAVGAHTLLRARRRGAAGGEGRAPFRWTCPSCANGGEDDPWGEDPLNRGPGRRGSPRR